VQDGTPTQVGDTARFDRAAFDTSRMGAFARAASTRTGRDLSDLDRLWRWSVDEPAQYWAEVLSWFGVPFAQPPTAIVSGRMPHAHWFAGARLNYADLVLRHRRLPGPAVIAVDEDGTRTEVAWATLAEQVEAFAATLRLLGVQPGDRVGGYLTAGVEAIVAFLGSASVGAIWAACGPDYGAAAAGDRLAQLHPRVLVATTGYRWNGKEFDRRDVVEELAGTLTTPEGGPVTVIEVPRLGLRMPGVVRTWAEAIEPGGPDSGWEPVPVDAEHPLWVLFSSGTTGIPKGILHGHAGVAAVHMTMLGLHLGLGRGDRLFWYTTTNWMMWNLAVSALTVGATVVTYEGSPTSPSADRLWEVAAGCAVDVFGCSPGYLQACAAAGHRPGVEHDLSRVRHVGVTGSPLPPSMNAWVADAVSPGVVVGSTSGGTDVVSGFLGWAPGLPVRPGELAGPVLGVAADVWDGDGRPVADEVGELVVTQPIPSMPVGFWDDPGGTRYREAYFSTYPGVWRQGDWATRHSGGGFTLHGRSDSTLNRGGVRIGSADLYAIVEAMPEVAEALVLGVEQPDGGYWMPMFVVLADGIELDSAVRERIRSALRTHGSPRHVPDDLFAVEAIPHTKTGKKLEVPLKRILQGADPAAVASAGAVDRPELLRFYQDLSQPG
jgi:acetoacetyl-CoA synthetase